MISWKIAQNTQKSNPNLIVGFLVRKLMSLIHIDTLKTPNPNFLKFVPTGKDVMGNKGSLDIPGPQYANISPLAE